VLFCGSPFPLEDCHARTRESALAGLVAIPTTKRKNTPPPVMPKYIFGTWNENLIAS